MDPTIFHTKNTSSVNSDRLLEAYKETQTPKCFISYNQKVFPYDALLSQNPLFSHKDYVNFPIKKTRDSCELKIKIVFLYVDTVCMKNTSGRD